jgi:hypothetical protein
MMKDLDDLIEPAKLRLAAHQDLMDSYHEPEIEALKRNLPQIEPPPEPEKVKPEVLPRSGATKPLPKPDQLVLN